MLGLAPSPGLPQPCASPLGQFILYVIFTCPMLSLSTPPPHPHPRQCTLSWELLRGSVGDDFDDLLMSLFPGQCTHSPAADFLSGELPYVRKLACQENYDIPRPNWGQPVTG